MIQAPGNLSSNPFFDGPGRRVALARERYFDEGVRPSGLVGEIVIQSWSRCVQAHRDPRERVAFDPVTPSRIHSALGQSRLLLETAANELSQLESTLAGSGCTVLLTDGHGVVVHAHHPPAHAEAVLLPLASRIGVNLSEGQIGTAAPGVTARTGQPSVVLGGEHFFGCMRAMHCAAAPIRDVHGRVAGVLDISSESRPFGFDAAAVVGLYAVAIENRLLRAQSAEHVVVHLQASPALLGTPMEGLVGVASDGRVAWVNVAAAQLLGVAAGALQLRAEDLFAIDPSGLAALTRRREAGPHRLPNGLTVWLAARMQAPDGVRAAIGLGAPAAKRPRDDGAGALPVAQVGVGRAAGAAPAPSEPGAGAPAPGTTLRDSDLHLIERTLGACGGNVSKAARALGVSRGLVYRHLRQARAG